MRRIILLFCFLSAIGVTLQAQIQRPTPGTPAKADTTKNDQVLVDFADLFEYIQGRDSTIQKLLGNVELRQDSVFMYCDSAIIINETDVIAMGNVIIQQGDSISVFADSLAYQGKKRIADLFGNVILLNGAHQKLYTDVLRYDLGEKLATYETGALLTNDTTQLTSKRGYYFLKTDDVFFRDSVQVVSPDFELKSDTLKFNTRQQKATFLGPTLITEEISKIYCEGGYYKVRDNEALFSRNAQYLKLETQTKATADSIHYDGDRKMVSLLGKARFEEPGKLATADVLRYDEVRDITYLEGRAVYIEDQQEIRADTLTYDQRNEIYTTRGRSFVSDPPQLIEADQLDYDQSRGLGIALGNVIWRDTSSDLSILCAQADYDEKTDYLKAFGGRANRPLLITLIDGDSLFLTADTLIAFRPQPSTAVESASPVQDSTRQSPGGLDTLQLTQLRPDSLMADTLSALVEVPADSLRSPVASASGDSSRVLNAFKDVRILKSNLQAVCDSLSYSTVDSLFRLYVKPIIWSDTSQFNSDTVYIQLADDKIDQILLRNRALIVNSPDELFFNQIRGSNITAFLKESKVYKMDVVGTAQSIYYSLDDAGAYMGVNQTDCSEMTLFFEDSKIEQIKFYNNPTGKFIPMQEADHAALKLTGFFWEVERRPKVLEDLFTLSKALPTEAPAPEKEGAPTDAGDLPEEAPLPPKPRN